MLRPGGVLGVLLAVAACNSSRFVHITNLSVVPEPTGGGELDWHRAAVEPSGDGPGGVTVDVSQESFPCDPGFAVVAVHVCAGRSRSCEMQDPTPIAPRLWVQYRCGTADPPAGAPPVPVPPAGP